MAAKHKNIIKGLAKLGYIARGITYGAVGILALKYALGMGGKTTNRGGAIETISSQPFGELLLIIIALGLVGYSVWKFTQAFVNTIDTSSTIKEYIQRIGSFVSGVIHLSLTYVTIKMIMGSSSGGNSTKELVSKLMEQPFGQWLVGTIGIIILGFAAQQFYHAVSKTFKDKFKLSQMSNNEVKLVIRTGISGLISRSVIFFIMGFFMIQAARNYNPNRTTGLGGALLILSKQPYGPYVLGLVSLGLILYSVYSFISFKYRKIQVN